MRARTAYFMCLGSFILGCMVTLNLVKIDVRTPTTASSRHDETSPLLIVLIMSDPKNNNQRAAIRRSWVSSLNKNHKHYFVIATKDLDDNTMDSINNENNKYGDLLLLEQLQDSYYSLTEKLIQSLHAIKSISFQYLLKCDDDTFVHIKNFENELALLSKSMTSLYWGFFRGDAKLKTRGKWKESDWNICDMYLPYALGGGYVLSRDLVLFITNNSHMLRQYNSEDVSVGAWLANVKTHRKHDTRFNTEHVSRGCMNSYLVVHKQSSKFILKLHKNLQTLGNICITEFQNYPSFEYNWNVLPSQCCVRTKTVV